MKASSESGECANLISVILPGAGFVGIAVRNLSLLSFSQRPVRQLQSHSGLLVCQAHLSHWKIDATPRHGEERLERIPIQRKPHN